MDAVLLHLRINHAPIMFSVVGAVFFLIGLLSRRATLIRYGQISLIIAAVAAPAAFFSGREAEEHTENTWYIDKKTVHEHEEPAEWAAVLMVITGLLAVASLRAGRPNASPKEKKILYTLVAITAIMSAAAMMRTAFEGGAIVHKNAKLINPPQPSALPQSAQ